MRLALVQMSSDADTTAGNVAKACDFVDEAARERPDLIVLPEFFNSGYYFMYRDYEHYSLAERDDGPTMTAIMDKARQHKTNIVATIYEEQSPGIYYDTAIFVDPEGAIIGKYRKTHPAGVRAMEKIYFRYGTKFPVFQIADLKVGAVICYDFSFPETARSVALNGAELIVVPFCSPAYYYSADATSVPAEVGQGETDEELRRFKWKAQAVTRASENMVYVAPCNHSGRELDAMMGGGSMIVDPQGRTLAIIEDDEGVIYADLDREEVRQAHINRPNLRDRRPDLYGAITTESDDLHP